MEETVPTIRILMLQRNICAWKILESTHYSSINDRSLIILTKRFALPK